MTSQVVPTLSVKEIQDVYLRQNFQALVNYFTSQNQLLNFNFFDLSFSGVVQNQKQAHGLNVIPKDILVAQITGAGNVTFNVGLFDSNNLDISTTGACRVRFFVGSYWNLQNSTNNANADTMTFSANIAESVSSSIGQKIIKNVAQYNALITDTFIGIDCTKSSVNVILPPTSIADQQKLVIEKIDSTSNAVSVVVSNSSSEFIRSANSFSLSSQWSSKTLFCVKPTWYY
jgi:hypothetical protein